MIINDIYSLTDDEISRLLYLRQGVCFVTYGEPDKGVLSLEEQGYIIHDDSLMYDFTEQGKELIEKFWSEYTDIILKEVKETGANFQTYEKIVKQTGISWRIIEHLARDLGIKFIP